VTFLSGLGPREWAGGKRVDSGVLTVYNTRKNPNMDSCLGIGHFRPKYYQISGKLNSFSIIF